MRLRVPASLRLTVPLILLGFAATLSAFNVLYHVPRAERAAEQESRKRLAQEMSRLQSTLEYLLLKGDQAVAQHEIAVLAHNHDYLYVCLTDDRGLVIATTRRAWLGRGIAEAVAEFDPGEAARAVRERHARGVEPRGPVEHGGIARVGELALLQRRRKDADADRFPENQDVSCDCRAVPFDFPGINQP